MNKNIIYSLFIIIAIFFYGLGFATSSLMKIVTKSPALENAADIKNQIADNTYQAGWDAAKKRLTDSGLAPMNDMIEIKNVTGEVVGISGDKITLKIRPLEPLADPKLDTRIIIIDSTTKIYKNEQKETKSYQQDMEEFNKKMQAGAGKPGQIAAPLVPPDLFNKKPASLADIKTGMNITVNSDKDIRNSQEIQAKEIIMQSTLLPELPPISKETK